MEDTLASQTAKNYLRSMERSYDVARILQAESGRRFFMPLAKRDGSHVRHCPAAATATSTEDST